MAKPKRGRIVVQCYGNVCQAMIWCNDGHVHATDRMRGMRRALEHLYADRHRCSRCNQESKQ